MPDRWYIVSDNNLVLSPDCVREPKTGKPVAPKSDWWTPTPDEEDSLESEAMALRAMAKYKLTKPGARPLPVSQYVPNPIIARKPTVNGCYRPFETNHEPV